MMLRWMREMDRIDGVAGPRAAIRLKAMTGDWINTNPESRGILSVQVTARGGGLAVRPVSFGCPVPRDWGEAAADSVFADGMRSDHGMAWIVRYQSAAGWESQLQGNVNLGLLVLAAFHSALRPERPERPGWSSYFAREFYRRGGAVTASPGFAEAGPPPGGGAVDPEPLLGTWHNTNPAARGIARLDLERTSGTFTVRVLGVGSPAALSEFPALPDISALPASDTVDWGRAPANPFAHSPGARAAMAFSAAYDFGFQQVELQANVKQGVLVVASFNRFVADDPRSSYFTREFFYRQ